MIFLAGLMSCFSAAAQPLQKNKNAITSPAKPVTPLGPQIDFKERRYDFGRININIQYAKHRFTFVNIGDQPLVITNVHTSCGCTTPEWTRDTIKPGDSGFVDTKYETINRPGSFNKTVTVYSNATNNPFFHLDILGEVYKEELKNEIEIPNYGKMYFSEPTVEFKPLYDNGTDTQEVRLVNSSLFSTKFEPLNNLPAYCSVLNFPTSLEPGESRMIQIILDGRMIKSYGLGAFEIPVTSDNPMSPNLGLYVAYQRKQFFPKLTARQLAKAPKLTIGMKGDVLNFGGHNSGDVVDTTISFTNTGKQDLVFHQIYPECSCIRVTYPKMVLKPGESMPVSLSFDTVTKSGNNVQNVWIVCNDPSNPERFLHLQVLLPKIIRKCMTCPD